METYTHEQLLNVVEEENNNLLESIKYRVKKIEEVNLSSETKIFFKYVLLQIDALDKENKIRFEKLRTNVLMEEQAEKIDNYIKKITEERES